MREQMQQLTKNTWLITGKTNGRYPDANDLADDLDRFLKGDRILAKPKGTVAKVAGWVHRHKVITGLAAVALLALFLTLVLSGEVQKKTKEVAQLRRIDDLRLATEVSMALIEAQDLVIGVCGRKPVLVHAGCTVTLDGIVQPGEELDIEDLYQQKILGK